MFRERGIDGSDQIEQAAEVVRPWKLDLLCDEERLDGLLGGLFRVESDRTEVRQVAAEK